MNTPTEEFLFDEIPFQVFWTEEDKAKESDRFDETEKNVFFNNLYRLLEFEDETVSESKNQNFLDGTYENTCYNLASLNEQSLAKEEEFSKYPFLNESSMSNDTFFKPYCDDDVKIVNHKQKEPNHKPKRGRKPKPLSQYFKNGDYENRKSCLEFVRFGNKLVQKGTAEYFQRRVNSRQAVRKCREKYLTMQRERDERINTLQESNKKLEAEINSSFMNLKKIIEVFRDRIPDYLIDQYIVVSS